METYLIPAILIAGALAAAWVTRWINWYTWGANQEREEALKKRMAARARMREEAEKEKGPDHDSATEN